MRFLLLLFLISTSSYSQSIDFFVINNMGGSFESSDGQLTSNVGEASVNRRLGISELITDGFLQYRANPSIVTATTDPVEESSFSIYPNPTQDILKLIDLNESNYKIMDIKGAIVKEGIVNDLIDISQLGSGIYTIIIINQRITTTHKIVKQ